MPECHTCPYDGKATRRCITCNGFEEKGRKGTCFVSIDALDGHQSEIIPEIQVDWLPGCNTAMARAAAAMHAFLRLDRKTCRLVSAYMSSPNTPLRVLAKRMRFSTQAAHARLKKARKAWPALADAIPMKLLSEGKRKAGKNHHA